MENKKDNLNIIDNDNEKVVEFVQDGRNIKLVINAIKDNTKIISRRKDSDRGVAR